MKKTATLMMAALVLLAAILPGCTGETAKEGDKLILATFYPVYVTTLNIAQGIQGVTVEALAPPMAGCLHDYQLTTPDRRRVEDADIVVMNGLGMESFLDKITEGKSVVVASEGFAAIESKGGHDHEEEEDEEGHAHNPHVWVAPEGTIWQAERIRDGLMAADPDNAEAYAKNAQDYIGRLTALQEEMRGALNPYRGAKIATLHDSFAYFAREFGLDIVAVIKDDPESQLSARELNEAADAVRSEGARAIFTEEQYADTAAETLSRETQVPVYALDSAVMGETGDPDAYLDAMRGNAAVLAQALGLKP